MDLKELKELLRNGGGKVVVVEEGKPVMVVFSWQDFQGLLSETTANEEEAENGVTESSLPPAEDSSELTIDDLPL